MSTSAEELRQRIRERLAGVSRSPLTETEIVTALSNNGETPLEEVSAIIESQPKRWTPGVCGKCGNRFNARGRHLMVFYHQRKKPNGRWEITGQDRMYLCAGCHIGTMAFIEGEL